MYRVYLDWNVISNLKRTDDEKFCQLKSLISDNRDRLSIPFTTAHIDDLRKSIKPGISHDLLLKDLELLSEVSKNQFINWEENITKPTIGHPDRFYYDNIESWINPEQFDFSNIFDNLIASLDEVGLSSFGNIFQNTLKSIPIGEFAETDNINRVFNIETKYNNFWEFLNVFATTMGEMLSNKERFLQIRANVQNSGLNIPTDSGNWDEEKVFDNFDEILKSFGVQKTFIEMNEFVVKQIKKDKSTIYDEFTSLYMFLDLIGYKSDKLKKPSNTMINITNDGLHSFYGGHCDYLITDDSNLAKKSKSIYSKLNIKTKVFNTDEFISSFHDLFPKRYNHITDFISDLSILLSPQNFVEENHFDNGITSNVYRLQHLALDFFNYITITFYEEFGTTEIIFGREFQNYSRFIFYNEIDSLIKYILYLCDFNDDDSTVLKVRDSIFDKDEVVLILNTTLMKIALAKDDYKIKLVLSVNNKAINENEIFNQSATTV